MRIHREGYGIILGSTLFLVIVNGLLTYFNAPILAQQISLSISLVFYLLVVQFFRDPQRTTPQGENLIIAPADGKVVVIEEVTEPEYFKGTRKQVSIFMSPINVHVNRVPVSGEVVYSEYHPGKYLVAWHPKSSTENERTTVVIKNNRGEILFRQIAGALAKRIVNYAKPGSKYQMGQEYGFIKFGSRIDLFLPLDAEITVNLNEKTIGGETIIAKW
ncbi:MAG: phosphatidylserine decarboxylase family protein [Flavobacterium stagni]|jgi:phosphatidylserine decarboxylase